MPLLELYLASLLAIGTFRAGDAARAWWARRGAPAETVHTSYPNPFGVSSAESDDGHYATL